MKCLADKDLHERYCKVLGAIAELSAREFIEELAPKEIFPDMAVNLDVMERVIKIGERCGCEFAKEK